MKLWAKKTGTRTTGRQPQPRSSLSRVPLSLASPSRVSVSLVCPSVSLSSLSLSSLFLSLVRLSLSSVYQAVCRIVDSYANGRYDKAVEEAAKCFNTPEDASLKKHRVGGSYWARKRNNPTVQFPVAIANTLRMWHNEQNPHCTPEEAASRLISKAEHQHSLRYV